MPQVYFGKGENIPVDWNYGQCFENIGSSDPSVLKFNEDVCIFKSEPVLLHRHFRMLFIVTVELISFLNCIMNCHHLQIDSSEANSRLANQEIVVCI